jgi:phosphatidylglycerol---prolipoprotein diacylglyceryl transferase
MFPTIFKFGPFTVYSLWVCVVIALIISSLLLIKKAKYERLDIRFVLDHSLSLLIGAAFMGRLVYFLTNWGYFGPLDVMTVLKQILYFWQPGYSFWGALIGFTLIFWYHARKKEEDILEWAEISIIPIFIGIMIGNLGQFLDGQAYGSETILPWGVVFENTNVKYTVPIHPTQIYSILVILAIIFTRKKVLAKWPKLGEKHNWALFAISAYSLSRFGMEFLRGDDTFQIGPIRVGHVVTLIIFAISARILYKRTRTTKPKKK